MIRNGIRQRWSEGKTVVNGWLSMASPFSAEIMAAQGYDSLTVDIQHGLVGYETATAMLQALRASGVTPMVRVPWLAPGDIMKALDAGAYGIICPMINSKAEAEAFVSYGRYAPRGTRSMGPNRAVQYGGADYWQHANEECLMLAMIETRAAVANLDEILSVPGLGGVYVGPSDLSMSMLGHSPTLDPSDTGVIEAIKEIARKTRAKGLIAGVHTDSAKTALTRYDQGYNFCTLLNDARMMSVAANQMVRDVRGQSPAERAKTY